MSIYINHYQSTFQLSSRTNVTVRYRQSNDGIEIAPASSSSLTYIHTTHTFNISSGTTFQSRPFKIRDFIPMASVASAKFSHYAVCQHMMIIDISIVSLIKYTYKLTPVWVISNRCRNAFIVWNSVVFELFLSLMRTMRHERRSGYSKNIQHVGIL